MVKLYAVDPWLNFRFKDLLQPSFDRVKGMTSDGHDRIGFAAFLADPIN